MDTRAARFFANLPDTFFWNPWRMYELPWRGFGPGWSYSVAVRAFYKKNYKAFYLEKILKCSHLGCDIKTKNFGFLGFWTKKFLTKKIVTKKPRIFSWFFKVFVYYWKPLWSKTPKTEGLCNFLVRKWLDLLKIRWFSNEFSEKHKQFCKKVIFSAKK